MGKGSNNHQGFIKEIFTLALPAGIQQVINLTVNLIDNLMIGSLGEASISAVAICGNYMWLVNTFVNGLAGGAVIIAAQDWGNKNTKRIKKTDFNDSDFCCVDWLDFLYHYFFIS